MANNLVINLALKDQGFKKQIDDAKKDVKLLKSEFDNASAGSKDFEKSLEGQNAKLTQLKGTLEAVKRQSEVYQEQLNKSRQSIETLTDKINKQTDVVNETKKKIEESTVTYGKNSDEVKNLKEELDKQEKTLSGYQRTVVSANGHMKDMETQLNNSQAEMKRLESEIDDTEQALDRAEKVVDEFGNSLDKSNGKLGQFGTEMTIAGAGLVKLGDTASDTGKKIVSVFGDLVNKGSEYNASMASTEFMMKTLDQTTQNWIKTASENAEIIGLTPTQYEKLATSVGVYARNAGFAGQESVDFSKKIVELSADMAALIDEPVADSLDAIKSALVGNFNAVDKFGMTISVATINESEYVKQLGLKWDKMNMNQKAQAIMNEMMRQGSAATGLAAEEANQYGMKTKLVTEQLAEMTGLLGETLLPLLEPIVNKMSEIVKAMSEWVKANPNLSRTLLVIGGVIGVILVVLGNFLSTIGLLTIGLGAMSTAIAKAGGLAAFMATSVMPIITVLGVVIATAALLALAIKENWAGIQQATFELLNQCKPYFEDFIEAFSELWDAAVDIYNSVIKPLFRFIGEVIEQLIIMATPILQFLLVLFTDIMKGLVKIWESVGKPLFEIMGIGFKVLKEVFGPVFISMKDLFIKTVEAIQGVWSTILAPTFGLLIDIIGVIFKTIKPIYEFFAEPVIAAMKAVISPIQTVIDTVRSLIGWVGDAMKALSGLFKKKDQYQAPTGSTGGGGTGTNVETRDMSTMALSGSYYQADTPSSMDITTKSLNFKNDNSELLKAIKDLKNNDSKKYDQTINIYSPTPTNPVENARLIKLATRKMILGV